MSAPDAERVLDVREIDGPPFEDIVRALESMDHGDRLRLIAPFEPRPLYDVLDQRGLAFETEETESGLYHVLVERA